MHFVANISFTINLFSQYPPIINRSNRPLLSWATAANLGWSICALGPILGPQCLPLWIQSLSTHWSTPTGRTQTSSFCVDFIKNSSTSDWGGFTARYNGTPCPNLASTHLTYKTWSSQWNAQNSKTVIAAN